MEVDIAAGLGGAPLALPGSKWEVDKRAALCAIRHKAGLAGGGGPLPAASCSTGRHYVAAPWQPTCIVVCFG